MPKTKITEWSISIDRGGLEETAKLDSGIIMSRKGKTDDIFSYILDHVSIPYHTHALVRGGVINGVPTHTWPPDEIDGLYNIDPIPLPEWDDGVEGRKCFNCQKKIGYGDFRLRNRIMNHETLKKIWNSPHVQLYCCNCFMKKNLFEKLVKKRERLINKAYRINEKFGFLVD